MGDTCIESARSRRVLCLSVRNPSRTPPFDARTSSATTTTIRRHPCTTSPPTSTNPQLGTEGPMSTRDPSGGLFLGGESRFEVAHHAAVDDVAEVSFEDAH